MIPVHPNGRINDALRDLADAIREWNRVTGEKSVADVKIGNFFYRIEDGKYVPPRED